MKLDTKHLRYLNTDDWRVLNAVELGSRTHLLVPLPLIQKLSKISSHGHLQKSLWALSKAGLVSTVPNAKYPGFRLAYGGLDHLALHAHSKSNVVYSVGNQIGTGKESDIVAVAPPPSSSPVPPDAGRAERGQSRKEVQYALKIHRLGRISFRSVKTNRDYLSTARSNRHNRHNRTTSTTSQKSAEGSSWMHLSRLAALKEWTFLTCLHAHAFPVPRPVAHNRHTIVMELIDGFPLRQVESVPDPRGLYAELVELLLRLARYGLIHGDFNEFNILIREDPLEREEEDEEEDEEEKEGDPDGAGEAGERGQSERVGAEADDAKQQHQHQQSETEGSRETKIKLTPILIDFPQMVSMSHPDARSYFERDVACVKRYFERRFGFTSDEPGPFFEDALKTVGREGARLLDVEAYASGFSKKMAKELDAYMKEKGGDDEQPAIEGLEIAGDDSDGPPDEYIED